MIPEIPLSVIFLRAPTWDVACAGGISAVLGAGRRAARAQSRIQGPLGNCCAGPGVRDPPPDPRCEHGCRAAARCAAENLEEPSLIWTWVFQQAEGAAFKGAERAPDLAPEGRWEARTIMQPKPTHVSA